MSDAVTSEVSTQSLHFDTNSNYRADQSPRVVRPAVRPSTTGYRRHARDVNADVRVEPRSIMQH